MFFLKTLLGIFKIALRLRSAFFYATIIGNFHRFQYFNFASSFLDNENFFQQTGEMFFSWKY